MYDVVRGVQKRIVPNDTPAEDTVPGVTAFGTDGFTVGSETDTNGGSRNFVGWSWKAGAGQGSSNTDGSINTTYTSVNTTAGFSISTYTGTGNSGATVGHGLGVAPSMIIARRLDGVEDWGVYHKTLGASKYIILNTEASASSSTSRWGGVEPTNSVFTLGNHASVNSSGGTHVAYCFAEKTGYSKFGSYTGNGNADNAFIYTGFRPTFFMTKRYSDTARWVVWDAVRDPYNNVGRLIYANENSEEGGYTAYLDFTSNGIKILDGNSKWGANGSNYIYWAFGQSLVGSNNIPCTAR